MKNYIILLLLTFALSLQAQVNNKIQYPEQIDSVGFNEISGFPSDVGAAGQVLQVDPTGTKLEYADPLDAPIKTTDNGLTLNGTEAELGGTLNRTTDIDLSTFPLSFTNPYATYFQGNNGTFDAAWITKSTSATTSTNVGIMDLTAFGQDPDQVILGELDFTGARATYMFIRPTSGEIISRAKDRISIGANNSTGLAGEHNGALSINPYATVPSMILQLNREQQYALGYAALDNDGDKKYSNIYYGELDASNNITDISRIEAADIGSSMMFMHDAPNLKSTRFVVDEIGMRLEESDAGNILSSDLSGELTVHKYPSNRDDSGTTNPSNFLYTDSGGSLQSAPVASILKFKRELFILVGGETSILLTAAPSTPNNVILSLNGQILYEGASEDWTMLGNSISFNSYIGEAGKKIEVKYF